MPVAREQLSTSMLDHGECPEAVHFQFVNPVGIIEGSGTALQWHWLENLHKRKQNTKWDELLCSKVKLNFIIPWNDSATCFGKCHGSEMSWLMSLSEWGESTV